MTLKIDQIRAGDSAEIVRFAELLNSSYAHESGCATLQWDPANLASRFAHQDHRTIRLFVARENGDMVAGGSLEFDRSTSHDVEFGLAVDPARDYAAIADALYDRIEDEARAMGRTNAIEYTASAVDVRDLDEADVIRPPDGVGGMPRAADNVRMMLARGYTLGLIERASEHDLRADDAPIRDLLARATERAGADYEAVWWMGRTPDEYLDAYAYAISRMSTDAPHGSIDVEEEAWDAARIRAREERVAAIGQLWGITAVRHRPTGRIVAFNELVVDADRTASTENYGTLVLAEHRGRRLGTIVKCLGLLKWREHVPESPRVFTFNAEVNRYMLDVNEAVGFVPRFWEGAWSKRLA